MTGSYFSQDAQGLSDQVSYTPGSNAQGESVQIPDRSHHPDGSRTWRYSPSADPNDWPTDYVDQNIEQAMTLGWVVPNEAGQAWTVGEAAQLHAQWVTDTTSAYFADQDQLQDNAVDLDWSVYQHEGQPQGDIPQAPPAPEWNRPGEAHQGAYGNVMDELRGTVPENEGLWTATQAAQAYGDTQFLDEQGVTAAHDRAAATSGRMSQDGTLSFEDFTAMNDANAEVAGTYAQTDSTRNRYQQSTDFQPSMPVDQQLADVEQGRQQAAQTAADDPRAMGLGMTVEQQYARGEAQEYASATGQQIDLDVPLNDEQRAWLEQYRRNQEAEEQRLQAEWAATPEGQEQTARAQRQQEQATTRDERVRASQQATDERIRAREAQQNQ